MLMTRRKFLLPWSKDVTTTKENATLDANTINAKVDVTTDVTIDMTIDMPDPCEPAYRPRSLSFDACKQLYQKVRTWEHISTAFNGIDYTQFSGDTKLGTVDVRVIVSYVRGEGITPKCGISIARDTAIAANYRTGRNMLTPTQESELHSMFTHALLDYAK